jgi:hemoglobin
MNLEITYGEFGVRPPVTKAIPEFLIEIGEEGLRQLVSDHYDALKESDIKHLFPLDDEEFKLAKQHSADFMIQICGGPAYFNQNRGAPQMVGRHAPFRIDAKARETWLKLYQPLFLELKEKGITERSLESFWNYLNVFSLWMVNTK